MSDLPPLVQVSWVDLPVVEASGLATRTVDGVLEVIVVGDRTSQVGVGSYTPTEGFTDWRIIDLALADGWPSPLNDSQLEAVAVDGGRLVAMMREDPPIVLVADAEERRLRAQIALTAPPGSPLRGKWGDPSSRGEGLVMLRGGRLLVAKEKRPAALVEFCPVGEPARGISRDDFLGPDEEWDSPDGEVEFVATAMWRLKGRAKKTIRDISDLAVAGDRTLWLLSDKSASVARLDLDTPLPSAGGKLRSVDHAWHLPEGSAKPEGIASLGDRRVLVAMDTDSERRNGLIAEFLVGDDRPTRRVAT